MESVLIGWGVALLVGLLLAPLILQALWWILAHHILGRLTDRGWIAPRLKYGTALQVILSFLVVFVGLPFLLGLLLILWPAAGRGGDSPSDAAQVLSIFLALPLVYGAYFVLIGALWLQWLWRRLSKELLPRALEEGVLSPRLSYVTGVLIMLLIVALYLLQALLGFLATALSVRSPFP